MSPAFKAMQTTLLVSRQYTIGNGCGREVIIHYILIDGKMSLVYEKRTQKVNKGVETRFYANNEPVCGWFFSQAGGDEKLIM